MTEKFLTLQDIEAYFLERSEMELSAGIQIELLGDLWITGNLWDKKPVAFDLVLLLREDDPQFAEKMAIGSIQELEGLTIDYLWEQYEKGNAQVSAVMYELFDMEIGFRQKEGKTYVSRNESDERLVEVLEETSQDINWFRAYVRDNAKRWYEMAEERNEDIE